MAAFFESVKTSLMQLQILDFVDMLLVAVIVYFLLKFTKRTRAIQVLKGLGIIIVVAYLCELLRLPTVTWLLNYVIQAGALMLVIIFQPEIRRALERIGRGKILGISLSPQNGLSEDVAKVIEEIHKAILNLSIHKTGALIVFEQKTGLKEVIESGIILNAQISSEVIENVFFPNAPLHDGAMIIKDDVIVAAGCFLPLSDNKQISSDLGTRHRAALGISEISDCVVLVVSEETGVISMAREGVLERYLDSKGLRILLEKMMVPTQTDTRRKIVFKRKGSRNEKNS